MNIRAEILGSGTKKALLKEKKPKAVDGKALTDIAITREETRRANDRAEDRFRLTSVLAKVNFQGRDHEVEVVNLSGGGAMIAADITPNIGERICLAMGESTSVECAVRWIKEGRLGLEFAHETQLQCSEDEQAALLREVIERDFPSHNFRRSRHTEQVTEPRDERAALRHPLIWWGELHCGSQSCRVRLRNISANGALIECPGAVRLGSEVALDLAKAGTVTASVVRVVGDHLGLMFDGTFDMARLGHAKPSVMPPKWLRPAYLESAVHADSAWDNAWQRMSVDDLRAELEGFLKR